MNKKTMALTFYGDGIKAWYARLGGKSRLSKKLYALFPNEDTYTTYVEPFFGAGWLFFEKDKSPKEVINDLDKDIYYAMKDIRTIQPEQIQQMDFTPSKAHFLQLKASKPTTAESRLYRFLYIKWASFSGNMTTYNSTQAKAMPRRQKNLIRRLPEIQERLKGVVILNQDYSKVIKKYDSPSSFFYFDPPYLELETREYKHKTISIEDLAEQLRSLKGRFLLSYNDHPTIRKAFQGMNITTIETVYKIGGVQRPVTELVITNY